VWVGGGEQALRQAQATARSWVGDRGMGACGVGWREESEAERGKRLGDGSRVAGRRGSEWVACVLFGEGC
jgi:hypothetical protein